jgi:hypothetical protein
MATSDGPKKTWVGTLFTRLLNAVPKQGIPLSSLAGHTALFHYTGADGLKGIFEDNCLWATGASYLNDASEIEYGCAVLGDVLAHWEESNKDSASLQGKIVASIRNSLDAPASKFERAMTIYVACFCERDNLLSQWRAYGQTGGYSVGFSLLEPGLGNSPILKKLKPESTSYRANLVRVIYDRKEQTHRLEEVLQETLAAADQPDLEDEVASLGKDAVQKYLGICIIGIEMFLMEQIVSFKNAAFAEEREWRIVVQPALSQTPLLEGKKDPAVYLRSGRSLLFPYVKIVPTDDKLPIESVRFGPTLNKTRADNSLKVLLSLHGYENVKIHGSDIPVVF